MIVGQLAQVLEERVLDLPQPADVLTQQLCLRALAELGQHTVEVGDPHVRPGQADDLERGEEVRGEIARHFHGGDEFRAGPRRHLLDIHGQNHDPRLREGSWGAYDLIPRGDHEGPAAGAVVALAGLDYDVLTAVPAAWSEQPVARPIPTIAIPSWSASPLPPSVSIR
ncbi:hypothetical protein ABZ917_32370 [Nonomuraea wenchangensis]